MLSFHIYVFPLGPLEFLDVCVSASFSDNTRRQNDCSQYLWLTWLKWLRFLHAIHCNRYSSYCFYNCFSSFSTLSLNLRLVSRSVCLFAIPFFVYLLPLMLSVFHLFCLRDNRAICAGVCLCFFAGDQFLHFCDTRLNRARWKILSTTPVMFIYLETCIISFLLLSDIISTKCSKSDTFQTFFALPTLYLQTLKILWPLPMDT